MSPAQNASRLIDIADGIDSARRLVEAGDMATARLTREDREAMSELLREVATRLERAADSIHSALQDAA